MRIELIKHYLSLYCELRGDEFVSMMYSNPLTFNEALYILQIIQLSKTLKKIIDEKTEQENNKKVLKRTLLTPFDLLY